MEKEKGKKKKNKAVIKREKTVKVLQGKLSAKIKGFAGKHETYLFCYPNGIKIVKKIIKSTCYRQHIYVCHSLCQKQCIAFKRKAYICKDIGCNEFRSCELLPFDKMKAYCKRQKLYKKRLARIKIYKKYFYLMSVFRGLKLDPVKTIKFLKKKKEEKINGQV